MTKFIIKEVFQYIKSAKVSFLLSLLSTCLSVVLVTTSYILLTLSSNFENSIKEKLTFNLFISENFAGDDTIVLKEKLSGLSFVKTINYLDKEAAAQSFIKETGEDFRKVIDYNPLPASVEVKLKPEYVSSINIEQITKQFKSIEGVDEVVFQSEAVYKILSIISSVRIYVLAVAVFLILLSVYIVFSTNRLIINSKLIELETMKLVGARLSTIKLPIILNGFIIGITSSFISFLLMKLLTQLLKDNYLTESIVYVNNFSLYVLVVILLSGPLIGLSGGIFSVRKITLRIF
ncbi:MAG: permease-like cell division protein FtsX [Ignavibacteria bacterium]